MFKWNKSSQNQTVEEQAFIPQREGEIKIKKVGLNSSYADFTVHKGESQEAFEQAVQAHYAEQQVQMQNPFSAQGEEKEYLVLEDTETKIIYYMDVIDTFMVQNQTYSAMFSYEAEKKEEIILMRVEPDQEAPLGYRYVAIYDTEELNMAFDAFFMRYEAVQPHEFN